MITRIEIIDYETLHKREMQEIKEGTFLKNEHVLYFETYETFCKVFTSKRLELLRAIREKKPKSIYAIARYLGRDYKNVQTDAQQLQLSGLITLKKVKNGRRVSLRPVSRSNRIELKMAI